MFIKSSNNSLIDKYKSLINQRRSNVSAVYRENFGLLNKRGMQSCDPTEMQNWKKGKEDFLFAYYVSQLFQVSYKFKPVTECKLSPVEICAPAGCGVKEGPEECYDRR